ncbi:hypothetical protein [Puniceibacterium sp. IMCC21224]|uniref:hypothetical protein n=1 Tax=Puniceibacterium sp. IMCC21224 TaxID=1618204 RepID=UPI00064D968B|nr:hypothetical protein [Puniceibacterium sp. IMCC21224]KMK65386.1 hypothetical protein IMCC21224_11217 [Puniceibacterium sp. IMCC21224]
MRKILFTLISICLPAIGHAQTLTVRSGEHGSFTRLAIDLQGETGWDMMFAKGEKKAVIRFPGANFDFDLSSVFSRIDRRRVGDLKALPGSDGLEIDVACACRVTAFLSGVRMLVIDVSDGEAEATDTVDKEAEAVAAFSAIDLGERPGIGPRPMTGPLFSAYGIPPDPIASEEGGLKRVQIQLTQQLARAATKGLLDTDVDHVREQSPVSDSRLPLVHQDEKLSNTATNDRLTFSRNEDRLLLSKSPCFANSDLDIVHWADETPFSRQLGEYRQKIAGELDRSDDVSVLGMAKFYLHFGLGAEARNTLGMLSKEAPVPLQAMAQVLDGNEDSESAFAGQLSCDSNASLWAVLASSRSDAQNVVNTQSVLRGFDELPTNLRLLLGRRVSDRLMELGERHTARTVLQKVQQIHGQVAPEVVVARAEMGLMDGNSHIAKAELEVIARSDAEEASAEAVAALMRVSVEEGTPATADIAELASAYSTEYRGAEQGPEMWHAHIRALISTGDFAEAFAELDSGQPDTTGVIWSEVIQSLTERADDITFLKLILRPESFDNRMMEPETLVAVVNRLLNLGLPDAAQQVLRNSKVQPADRVRKTLMARIYLASSKPEDAEIALIGLQGDDILALRTEARTMMGDYDFAHNALARLGAQEEALSAAWISGNWQTVAESEDAVLSRAAQLAWADGQETPLAQEPTLSRSTALADASASSLEVLRNLLEKTKITSEFE